MTSLITVRRKAVVGDDGTIRISELPFAIGEEIEVTLRATALAEQETAIPPMLKGSVLYYEDPTAPVDDGGTFTLGSYGTRLE